MGVTGEQNQLATMVEPIHPATGEALRIHRHHGLPPRGRLHEQRARHDDPRPRGQHPGAEAAAARRGPIHQPGRLFGPFKGLNRRLKGVERV